MKSRGRNALVLAIYPQTRGIAFVLFERWGEPIDWAVQEIRGTEKNTRTLKRIDSLFSFHTPDIVLLQDTSHRDANRAPRIQRLSREIAALAERRCISVRMYAGTKVRRAFGLRHRAKTKQQIAEAIAKAVPALGLYVPPARKLWMSEHERMGLFEAAALAWMHFQKGCARRPVSCAADM